MPEILQRKINFGTLTRLSMGEGRFLDNTFVYTKVASYFTNEGSKLQDGNWNYVFALNIPKVYEG